MFILPKGIIQKSILGTPTPYEFEGITAMGVEHYDIYLSNKYGDYMTIPDGNHQKFIEQYTGETVGNGPFVDINNQIIGQHHGYYRYTVGQRKGVNVNREGKNYVLAIRPENNEVVVGRNKDLFKNELTADDFNWISGEAPKEPIRVQGRTRYHQTLADATATVLSDGRVRVIFDEPQRAITKGQSVVLYDGDVVLGGGTICDIKE